MCVPHVHLAQAIPTDAAADAAGLVVPAFGLLAGLTLLLVGGRLLRPGLALAGVCAGILAGLGVASNIDVGPVFGVPSGVLLPCAGALVGWALALALFRLAIALMSCVTFAGLGALGAAIVMLFTGHEAPPVPAAPETLTLVKSAQNIRDAARNGAMFDGARDVALRTSDGFGAYWQSVPVSSRPVFMLGLFGGALVGLVLGATLPRGTGAMVMALTGSAAAIGCALLLLERLGADLTQNLTPPMLLTAWAALGLLGMGIQMAANRPGHAGAPAPA